MISRAAECCFWMNRYVERVENTARLLRVHRSFILDVNLPSTERWRPVIVVSGERERFEKKYGAAAMDDGVLVQEYLTWDEECPVSIMSSLRNARENARTMREVISVDMWEALNDFWHWFRKGGARKLYSANRDGFYHHVRDWPHEFYGLSHASLMHDEPFDFMRLGMLLERGGQTARMLDIKHHMLTSPVRSSAAIESASWLLLLRTCSALEPFQKRHHEATTAANVASFLVLEPDFPRSIAHCVDRSWNFMKRIRADTPNGAHAAGLLEGLRNRLAGADIDAILKRGLHEELTELVNAISEICTAIRSDFFATQLPEHQLQGGVR